MMRRLFLVIMIGFFVGHSQANASLTYEQFQNSSVQHRQKIELEGLSYMIGGTLGLTTSLYFGITSREVMPKIGYGLMQVLSSAAITYGAKIYFVGDDLTDTAEELKLMNAQLERQRVPVESKKRIMNGIVEDKYQHIKMKYAREKKVKGSLELLTFATSLSTILFSQEQGTGSTITLGFVGLLSLVSGASDLLGSANIDVEQAFSLTSTPAWSSKRQPLYAGVTFHFD